MIVDYFLQLKRREFRNWKELEESYAKDFTVLKGKLQKYPSVEICSEETTYGTMAVKSQQEKVEQLFSIKLTYAPHKEPLGQRFPESTTLIDKAWLIDGTIKIPKDLEDIIDKVIIY